MTGYLIAEEGPLAGTLFSLDTEQEQDSFSLGRDADIVDFCLEDPMVSRKHAIIRYTEEGFLLENLSTVNPVTQNGLVVFDPVLLKEGDILQIGSTFFHFTYHRPEEVNTSLDATSEKGRENNDAASSSENSEELDDVHFGKNAQSRFLLKVLSGPNMGAEFALMPQTTYLIGKDPNICDLVFQDLSISRQHARISVTETEEIFIEDLGSRNGVIVNGELIEDKHPILSQDLVVLGTTSFILVDRLEPRETILSSALGSSGLQNQQTGKPHKEGTFRDTPKSSSWKEMRIPKRYLTVGLSLCALIFVGLFALFSLFRSETIVTKTVDETEPIRKAIGKFSSVEFSFNPHSGKLFLVGHVLTPIEHQELLYLVRGLPFVHSVEDAVIVDELVWQNMNALLMTNPKWNAVSMYAKTPGIFILRGYTQTLDDAESLADYVNRNFDYLDKLDNQVVVEKNLELEIESLLTERGLLSISFDLSNGEVVLSGKVGEQAHRTLLTSIQDLKQIPGVRIVKNYVALTSKDATRVDISGNYTVTGASNQSSNFGEEGRRFVVINGRILGRGDTLDGMQITAIESKSVFLEREGLGYVIHYALQ